MFDARDLDADPDEDGGAGGLPANTFLERLREESARSARYGTPLSVLAIVLENIDEVARERDGSLRERTTSYLAATLAAELRAFDRVARWPDGELVVVVPGADNPEAERVGRRLLERVRAVKIESAGMRKALSVSIGFATWTTDSTADELLERALAVAHRAGAERAVELNAAAADGAGF
ncbi:MAG TPA: diguanylate cyclase [Solirubrobacteraceae bacterium]|nr:diguanylate cyclase [Solirubrobacteraceae bacterium]